MKFINMNVFEILNDYFHVFIDRISLLSFCNVENYNNEIQMNLMFIEKKI